MIRTLAQIQSMLQGETNADGNRQDTRRDVSPFTLLRDVIDSLGTIVINLGGSTVWDDLRAPFTQVRRGALSKPDFDYTNLGLLFPQNDDAEIIYIIFQMPHSYKLGTDIYPHIHWQQMNGNSVVWKMEYKWFNKGGVVPAGFTAVTATAQRYTWSAGNLHQYDSWDALSGAAINELSSILLVKVFRDDNVDAGAGGGDALAFEYDIHYQLDTIGSKSEFIK